MRKLIYKLALLGMVQSAILGGLCLRSERLTRDEYLAEFCDKEVLLERTDGRRVIVTGGSGVAFGIDSSAVAEEMRRPAINLGLHGGLGFSVPIRQLFGRLHRNDIVVVSLEYEDFCDGIGDANLVARMLLHCPKSATLLSARDWKALSDGAFGALRGIAFGCPPTTGLYSRGAFNRLGDIGRGREGRRERAVLEDIKADNISFEKLRALRVAAELNKLNAYCRERGATLVFSFPAIPEPLYRLRKPTITSLERLLRGELRCVLVDRPEDLVYPMAMFFDTKYHLTREGAEQRTKQLVQELDRLSGGI